MTNIETKILNPKVKYPNGYAKRQDDGTLKKLYDEDYCILTKQIGTDIIRVIAKGFDYALIINDTYNTVLTSDLGQVIHDIIQYDNTDKLVNKINTYAKRWIKEVVPYEQGKVKTITEVGHKTIIYDSAEDFIKAIKNDLNMFYYDYPNHELETITIYKHNKSYYEIVLFLDDCDVEQHMTYIVHKNNIKDVIIEMKKHLTTSIINETNEVLMKEL